MGSGCASGLDLPGGGREDSWLRSQECFAPMGCYAQLSMGFTSMRSSHPAQSSNDVPSVPTLWETSWKHWFCTEGPHATQQLRASLEAAFPQALGLVRSCFPIGNKLPAELYQKALVTSETQLAAAHRPVLQRSARGRCFLPGCALYLDHSDPEQCSRVDGGSISISMSVCSNPDLVQL